ncbi:hypothetical protein, partial [Streptomyces sp. NPDC005093]
MSIPAQASDAPDAEPDGPEDRLRRFATIWSRATFPSTATSMTRPEFEQHLLPLARFLMSLSSRSGYWWCGGVAPSVTDQGPQDVDP